MHSGAVQSTNQEKRNEWIERNDRIKNEKKNKKQNRIYTPRIRTKTELASARMSEFFTHSTQRENFLKNVHDLDSS